MTDSARDDSGSFDRNSTDRNDRSDVQKRRAQRARHRISARRRFRKFTQSRRWSRRLARRGRSDDAQILKAIQKNLRAGKTVPSRICAEHGPPGLCAQRSYTPLNHYKVDTAKIMTADRMSAGRTD